MNTRVAFKLPSNNCEVVKIIQCTELYTRMRGEVVCDDCCEDCYLFSKSMQFGGQFLLATNLNHRKKHFNISYIKTMEDDYKRIFVLYKNNATYGKDYEVIEYFIPKEYAFYFTTNENDKNRKGWYQSYYGDDAECFYEKCPIEYSIGMEIEVSEVEIRKWNPNTQRYE